MRYENRKPTFHAREEVVRTRHKRGYPLPAPRHPFKGKHYLRRYYGLLIILMMVLSACGQANVPTPEATSTPSPTPTVTPTATLAATATLTATPTVTPTPEPPWYQTLDPASAALKYHYANVINDKAKVYASFQDAVGKTGNFGYLPYTPAYVAYTTTRSSQDGNAYSLTNNGWMDDVDLQPFTPSSFTGLLLTREVTFRFGWVLADTQSINSAGGAVKTYKRYQVVHQVPADKQKPGYFAVGQEEWLPDSAVALVDPSVPVEAGPDTCRFIYANLKAQTLSVYNNCKLVFATLISSGENSWTYEGRFAILYKQPYGTLTPPEGSTSQYYIEGVPYFMTYSGSFGFHAAYWHDSFGSPASHGCINLAPADAKWLYDWAGLGERVIISAGT